MIKCISLPADRNNSIVRMPNMDPLAPVIARITRPLAWLKESPLCQHLRPTELASRFLFARSEYDPRKECQK
jgi:hypothetical protein